MFSTKCALYQFFLFSFLSFLPHFPSQLSESTFSPPLPSLLRSFWQTENTFTHSVIDFPPCWAFLLCLPYMQYKHKLHKPLPLHSIILVFTAPFIVHRWPTFFLLYFILLYFSFTSLYIFRGGWEREGGVGFYVLFLKEAKWRRLSEPKRFIFHKNISKGAAVVWGKNNVLKAWTK